MLADNTKMQIIGKRYALQDVLGHGGMGSVYRAVDRLTASEVALKRVVAETEILDFSNTEDANDFRLALAQEFKLLASMRHPNVIQVLDYGFDDAQQPYFTMELLEGAENILQASVATTIETRLNYVVQILRALSYLHRRGVLHRDIKPANVMVANDQVKVLDFGLSVMYGRDQRTQNEEISGTTAGTLAYMAPEVLMGSPPTQSCDLYAVGVIAYELFAGKHPFNRDDVGALVNQIIYQMPDFEALESYPDLAPVILQLLQKNPEHRYADASEVIAALERVSKQPIPGESIEIRESFLQAARLVGRDSELDQLSTALHRVVKDQTHGSVWLVGGESGVGKSRLVEEIRIRGMVEGALVIRGQSVAVGRSPYHLWRTVLRWLGLIGNLNEIDAGIIKLLVPDVVTLPPHNLDAASSLDPVRVRSRLLHMLESTLREQSQPILMILEDLQWATSESLSLLKALSQLVHELPLIVIGSYRDDERPDLGDELPDVPVLKLERLSNQDIVELSAAMLGDVGGQEQVVNLLQRETEGNVLFVIEVLRALAEEAGELGQIGTMTLPESVFSGGIRAIIQDRLERLPEWTQPLLALAATIGRELDTRLLLKIADDDMFDLWLTACANAAVLELREGEWRFTHDRLREGVLERLSVEEYQKNHQQVAEAIEAQFGMEDRASSLAYHWREAGNGSKEDFYVLLAGEQSLRRGAYQEAIRFFERALGLIEEQNAPGSYLNMRRVYLMHRKAEAYLGFGYYSEAQALYEESLELSEEMTDSEGMARSLFALGEVAYAETKVDAARRFYQRSLTLYQEVENQSGIAKVLNSLGTIAYDMGDQSAATRLYQQALDISRELGNQWGMAGAVRPELPDTEERARLETREQLQLTLDAYAESDNKQGMADTFFQMGQISLEMQELDTARQHFQNSLALREEINDLSGCVAALDGLGRVSIETGDLREAESLLRRSLGHATRLDNKQLALEVLIQLARLLITEDKVENAIRILAFVIYYPSTSDDMVDLAETMTFELEDQYPSGRLKSHWEQGKSLPYADLIDSVLS